MHRPNVTIHFKDIHLSERVREEIEQRCTALGREFKELSHLEVTVIADGKGFQATGHATGKGTEAATHAKADEPHQAADRVVDKLRQRLRKVHDKRIFPRRREGRRNRGMVSTVESETEEVQA